MRRTGFTLIELVAVLVVAAIVGVTAAVQLGSIDATRASSAARALQRDITYTRERAMTAGLNHWMVFSVSTNSYSVLADTAASPGRSSALTLTDPSTGMPMLQRLGSNESAGASIASASFEGASEFGFDWLGRPIASNGDRLRSQGIVTLGSGHQVRVQAGTGVVTLVEP